MSIDELKLAVVLLLCGRGALRLPELIASKQASLDMG